MDSHALPLSPKRVAPLGELFHITRSNDFGRRLRFFSSLILEDGPVSDEGLSVIPWRSIARWFRVSEILDNLPKAGSRSSRRAKEVNTHPAAEWLSRSGLLP